MTAEAGKSTALKMCLACNREFSDDLLVCPSDNTTLITLKKNDEWLGQTLADSYQIAEMIGKGGMGVVYLGRHARMDRLVAIKMLQAELAQDDASVKRFEQEAKAASCLNHPNLITLHDFGIASTGQPFLVMEYLEGRSLLEIIKLDGPISPARATKIFSQAAEGLSHAHRQGIVHRDLKPSNILLTERNGDPDFVKVLDFGLAKLMPWSGKESQHLTKTGEVFGSPIYMSPEQCMGRELRPTSDIYSLCITLYEALVGKPPFRGPTSLQTASMHMQAPPPPFDEVRKDLCLPHALETVVMKGLQKDPKDRFQTMLEFSDALQSAMNNPAASQFVSSASIKPIQLDSTSTIPAYKAEQDKMRASSAVAKAYSAPPWKNIAIVVVSCLLLIVAAATTFWFAHGAGRAPDATVSGVLYYFNEPQQYVEILDGVQIRKLALSNDALGSLKDHDIGRSAAKSGLGDEIHARLKAGSTQIQSLGVQKRGNSPIDTACGAVSDFLEGACLDGVKNDVRNDTAHLSQLFEHGCAIRVGNVRLDEPSVRPAAAIKVKQSTNKETQILVDAASYLEKAQGYWLFTVDPKGQITAIEPASSKDWDRDN